MTSFDSGLEITLKTYEREYENYIKKTSQDMNNGHGRYLDRFMSFLKKDDILLEVGSGSGRDADYIESQGFSLLRSEVVHPFIEYQRKQGKEVVFFDVIEGDLHQRFDGILAKAVFLHFNKEQFAKALANVKKHLVDGGIFALTLMNGEGERYSSHKTESPRYFHYWRKEAVEKYLQDEGFEILFSGFTQGEKWIDLILRKK